VSKEQQFKDELLKRLNDVAKTTKPLKDNTEMVILKDGKRVSLKGKSVWATEKRAQNAVDAVIRGGDWRLKSNYIRRFLGHVNYSYNRNARQDDKVWSDKARAIRTKWAKDHLRIVPLKDYIIMESKRSKA